MLCLNRKLKITLFFQTQNFERKKSLLIRLNVKKYPTIK